MNRIKFHAGAIVCPTYFVPGYPIGAGVDTRCVVRQVQGSRVRVAREDGRGAPLWIDADALRIFGGAA